MMTEGMTVLVGNVACIGRTCLPIRAGFLALVQVSLHMQAKLPTSNGMAAQHHQAAVIDRLLPSFGTKLKPGRLFVLYV